MKWINNGKMISKSIVSFILCSFHAHVTRIIMHLTTIKTNLSSIYCIMGTDKNRHKRDANFFKKWGHICRQLNALKQIRRPSSQWSNLIFFVNIFYNSYIGWTGHEVTIKTQFFKRRKTNCGSSSPCSVVASVSNRLSTKFRTYQCNLLMKGTSHLYPVFTILSSYS